MKLWKIKKTALFAESWNIAYRKKACGSILVDKVSPFRVIPNSFHYWAADPMLVRDKEDTYVFVELYDYKLRRGTIGYCKLCEDESSEWKQVIVEDYHMSYPFVFSYNEDWYMIPETSGAGELTLYKALDFPDKWTKEKIIRTSVSWVDTTLWKDTDGWIAFSEDIKEDTFDYRMHLDDDFNIMDIITLPKRENELRCGGQIFRLGDYIIRVTQDCKEKYGGALLFRFFEDETLQYECNIIRIEPEELVFNTALYLDGMHTYSANDDIEVIDIKTRRFNIKNFLYRIVGKICRG